MKEAHTRAGNAAPSSAISRRNLLKLGAAGAAGMILPASASAKAALSTDSVYRIHPAIGIARIGNADPDSFYVGPEIPGQSSTEITGAAVQVRKTAGLVRPQAARFRIWQYQVQDGVLTPIREVTTLDEGIASITWSVHLANKKASFHKFYGPHGETMPALPVRNPSVTDRRSLEIDFGPRSISGASQSPVPFQSENVPSSYSASWPVDPSGNPVIDYLGQIRTDSQGRLLVLGGKGAAGYSASTQPPLPTYANNDGWFDDASDGPVTAVITFSDGTTAEVDGAWVLCPPPDFAPGIKNATTMYDLLFDMGVRAAGLIPANSALYLPGGPLYDMVRLHADWVWDTQVEFPNYTPDFDSEIRPILQTGYQYYFVDAKVTHKHDALLDPNLGNPDVQYLTDREGIFVYMRAPGGAYDPIGKGTMPRLRGDDPYIGQEPQYVKNFTLTPTQYGLMRNWAAGNFVATGAGSPPPTDVSPNGLDRAALENCVGGAFFPGIEASWQIRNPKLFSEPFRIDPGATSQYLNELGLPEGTPIGPGHFSRQMAVPWHADFNDCRNEGDYGWWPGQRPNDAVVLPSGARLDWARPTFKFDSGSQQSEHIDMVENWWKFGFVEQTFAGFVEMERAPQIP